MPVQWLRRLDKAPETPGALLREEGRPPAAELHLWPHRSLPNRGFVIFFALSAGLVAVPLLAVLGTPALWGLLPFVVIVFAAVWYALRRSTRDGRILEELRIWSDSMELIRREPGGHVLDWQANPYWVRLALHAQDGPVEDYLVLEGGGRDVELGAFLTPQERRELHAELEHALSRLR